SVRRGRGRPSRSRHGRNHPGTAARSARHRRALRLVPRRRGLCGGCDRARAPPAGGLRPGARARTADRDAPRGGANGHLPQRPARGQLHRRRRAGLGRGLGVRGHGRPVLRPGQLRGQQRARRGRRGRAARGVRFRGRAGPDADALHVRLPRGDVGRRPAGDLGARLRLRVLRRRALRAAAAHGLRRPFQGGAGVKERARAVVIGGGVGGCSVAYWLTKLGWDDVVLCERADLTSGSTFHSAGLVGQLRGSLSLTRMMMASVDLYRSLGEEVGLETGWHEVGSLRLASSEERMEELRRQAGWAKTFGLPLELISAEESRELFPLMSTDGVLGAAWLPTDGYLDPSQLTFALAEGAREGGARIFTNTRVTGIEQGRVRTERGDIEAEAIVIAGGMFSAELGRLAGVRIPVVPMSHEYIVTQPFRERDPQSALPTLRDPDLLIYFREEGGGLVMGGYERPAAPAFQPGEGLGFDRIPPDFNGRL